MLAPYDLKVEFSPLRLKKGDDRPVEMRVSVKNLDADETLTSVVIEIPKTIGFDRTGFVNRKEIRIGKMLPNEQKSFAVDLYSHTKTEAGSYNVKITANKHYRGYSHILSNTAKNVVLRIVR